MPVSPVYHLQLLYSTYVRQYHYKFRVNVLKRKWFRLGLDKNPRISEGREKNRENTEIKKQKYIKIRGAVKNNVLVH